jgi:hypothetical protein
VFLWNGIRKHAYFALSSFQTFGGEKRTVTTAPAAGNQLVKIVTMTGLKWLVRVPVIVHTAECHHTEMMMKFLPD